MNQSTFIENLRLRAFTLPRKALFPAAALAAVFASGSALQAQEDVDNEEVITLDEFVVTTGIRDSLAAGVEIKRNAYQLVDAIVAEDIGKFPDNNVVEALQRVSGVQVTDRAGGEVNTVSIRGLNDITTTINGRNIFTSSGRSVALADIPASLLNRVDVYKTRSASHIEHGIAGAIDVKTQRPFYFGGPRVVIAARGIYLEQGEDIDPNISALVSNVWETDAGRFGALINVSYARTHYLDQSVTSGAMVPFVTENPPAGWVPYERIFPTDGRVAENPIWQAGLEDGLPFAEGSTLLMNGQPVEYYLSRDAVFGSNLEGNRERPAVNVSLQFAPDNRSEYTLEVFYNGYRNETFNSLMFSFADWWGALGDNPAANTVLYPGTNIIKSRENIGFPYGFMSGDLNTGETDSYLYALNGKWELSDELTLRADLSYQESEFKQDFFAMRTERVHRSISVDFNSGGGLPAFGFGDDTATPNINESDLTDPRLWTIAQLYDNANWDEGDAMTLTVDGDYVRDMGIIEQVNFGIRYDNRGASEGSRTADTGVLGQNMADHPDLVHITRGFFDNRTDVPTSWAVADGRYIRANADEIRTLYNQSINAGLLTSDQLVIPENFNVDETTYATYAQADFSTEVGGNTLDGQFGVRFVKVDTDMNFRDPNTDARSSDSASTDKFLPSMVIRYSITENLRARFAYGQTLRRPNFDQLNPNITYVEDVTNIGYGTATGGNPDLEPTESKNYDISLEYYFGRASALYVTAFKREVDGLVVDFRRRVRFEDYDYILTQPDNASNGELDGWEFGVVWFPENLPDWADGFGIQASYTILDSEQDIPVTNDVGEVVGTDTTPFFGVSDSSYSVVLAYEKPSYSVRLSYVWRDDFLNNYEAALFANPLGIYRTAQESLDLQLTYRVTDNFVLTFDATNLTDEIYHSYYEYPDTHNFGNWIISRTFALGARYSF